jgi:undecaprenyl-diphosphatase
LLEIDEKLLLLINESGSETWDRLWLIISHKWSWVFFYGVLLYFLIKSFGIRKVVWIILAVAIAITISDQLSVHLFKEQFQRLRPCHNLDLIDIIRTVNGKCGGQYGFISSHASNTMALAFLIVTIAKRHWGPASYLLIAWSIIVGYSRVYLGVHFPTDVFIGWLFGGGIGLLTGLILNKLVLHKNPSS